MIRTVTAALLTGVAMMGAAKAENARLPFPDGDYSTDAALCPLSPEERVAREGDIVGNKLRIIEGSKLTNGYEMSCTITAVNAKGTAIRFDAMCNAEGEMEPVKGSWRKVSDTSFRIGERVFEKCE